MQKNFKIKVYKDDADEWRWSMLSTNGRIVADCSESYKRRSSCLKMAHKIAETAIEVDDGTE